MQDQTLKTELILAKVEGGLNQFEEYIDEMIELLGIGDTSLGVISSALLGMYDLLNDLAPQQSCTIVSLARHEGVEVSFLLEDIVFDQIKLRFEEMEHDLKVQKIKLLVDDYTLNELESSFVLKFETKSIYSVIASNRAGLLKTYFRRESETNIARNDIRKRD